VCLNFSLCLKISLILFNGRIVPCVFLIDCERGGGGVTGCSVLSASQAMTEVIYPQLTLQVLNIRGDHYFDIIIGFGGGVVYGN
jgi:hypothetical protein